MENKELWYAVVSDGDNDWGIGSFNYEEAKRMCMEFGDGHYIAVIDEGGDPICVREIKMEDF